MAGSVRTRPFRGWWAAFVLGVAVGLLARQPRLVEASDPEPGRWRQMLSIQEQKVRRSRAEFETHPCFTTARHYALHTTLLREYQCRALDAGVPISVGPVETAHQAALVALEHARSDEEHAEANRIVLRSSYYAP